MTIKKGEDWGGTAELSPDAPIVFTDAQLADLFEIDPNGSLIGPAMVGLRGPSEHDGAQPGDLARTVSARGDEHALRSGARPALPIDLAVVTFDGEQRVVAGSLVLRRSRWAGVVEGAMNASFLGDWNVTPTGHPNDGRLDVVRAELSISDRLKARNRLASGAHIPHPDISIRRLKTGSFQPDSRAKLWLDHREYGHVHDVEFVVHPDATTIVI